MINFQHQHQYVRVAFTNELQISF